MDRVKSDRLTFRLLESQPGWEWRGCEECGEDFQAPVESDYRVCPDCANLPESRMPKPTDTPAIGDVLVIDGKKFTLTKLVTAGSRDPEGFRIYVFRAEDGEEIQVPMMGNKRVEAMGYNTMGYDIDGRVYCYKDAYKVYSERMKAYDRPGIKGITPTRKNDPVWGLVCVECGKRLADVY